METLNDRQKDRISTLVSQPFTGFYLCTPSRGDSNLYASGNVAPTKWFVL